MVKHEIEKYVYDLGESGAPIPQNATPGTHISEYVDDIFNNGYNYIFFNGILWKLKKHDDFISYHSLSYNKAHHTLDEILNYVKTQYRKRKLKRILND